MSTNTTTSTSTSTSTTAPAPAPAPAAATAPATSASSSPPHAAPASHVLSAPGPMRHTGGPPLVVEDSSFWVVPRFGDLRFIGKGAYGMVVSALDSHTGKRVAIKKVLPFDHQTFCQRTLREIRMLCHFEHENIVKMLTVFTAAKMEDMKDVYVVLELMETDLHKVIKGLRHSKEKLSGSHVRFFTYQMLLALKYIHSANVLHRDLKPGNLLVNTTTCDLKICDFGLARVMDPEKDHAGMLTEYVATRWYRAPEVMLNAKNYTFALDMWSVGCILAEMLGSRPLFPGSDYVDLLSRIFSVMGTPRGDDLKWIQGERARRYVERMPVKPRVPFSSLFPEADPQALDLLEHLLTHDPARRYTAEQSLTHPYLSEYHDPDDEPICDQPFTKEAEMDSLPLPELKVEMFKEIESYHHRHPDA